MESHVMLCKKRVTSNHFLPYSVIQKQVLGFAHPEGEGIQQSMIHRGPLHGVSLTKDKLT